MVMDDRGAADPPSARSTVNQPPHRTGLVRPRLIGRLDRSRAGGLALVVAPAGFGKTTLVAQYAHRHAGPVAWHSVDAADAAAARTDKLLATAIHSASGPDNAQPAADARDAIRSAPAGLLVIVDNADHLLGTPDEELLEKLLSAAPRGVYVLLAGRRLTALNLLRHEVAGYFDVIGADQLRFRTWEVERLFADVYAEPLPPDDVAVLTRRTGGWAAGLAMFHLSTRGRAVSVRRRAVAALSDRWDLTRGYLARTVLAELSPEVRRFLVLTSVFDAVTPSRCDRLLSRTGSAAILEELTNHYALPVTADAGVYQYHQVLRSHLLAALVDDFGEAEAREWHSLAAKLLVTENARAEAARSYARAGDWRSVAGMLKELGAEVADDTEQPLTDLLPPWLLAEDPWLAYAEARRRLADGQLTAALESLRRAEILFGDDAARVVRQDRWIATIWLPGRQPARTHWSAWLRAATQRYPGVVAGEAMALAGPEGELVRLLAEVLAGNVMEAVRWAANPSSPNWGDTTLAGFALRLSGIGLRLLGSGDDVEFAQLALDLVQLADEADAAGHPWISRIARAACALGNDPVLAADANAVVEECEHRGDRWGAALALGITLLHDWRQGRMNHPGAAQLVARCRDLDAGALQVWAQVFAALLAAADGLPEAEMEVRAAASLAASAGVPGAHAAVTAAMARINPARHPQLLAEAVTQATASGLPPHSVRVWAGGTPSVEEVMPVTAPPAGLAPVPISITCFGGFRLEIDGRSVDINVVRARARSALRLLATHAGQMVHREVLIEALWPELAPAAATRNLQVTISAIRGLLERACGPGQPALLVRSDSAYGLALPPTGRSDTATFQAAVSQWRRLRSGPDRTAEAAAIRAALSVYGGDLLPEEGPADWAATAREQFRRQATELGRSLGVLELARGEISEAIAAAEQCLALDPFDDAAWQVLAKAYDRSDAPAKAAEVRRRYSAMLAGLGLDGDDDDPWRVEVSAATAGRTIPAQPRQQDGQPPRRTRT
jgi:DNA-binding SARP family transcriptional activator